MLVGEAAGDGRWVQKSTFGLDAARSRDWRPGFRCQACRQLGQRAAPSTVLPAPALTLAQEGFGDVPELDTTAGRAAEGRVQVQPGPGALCRIVVVEWGPSMQHKGPKLSSSDADAKAQKSAAVQQPVGGLIVVGARLTGTAQCICGGALHTVISP